jgi:serine/threonine protein phosphatase PrpC
VTVVFESAAVSSAGPRPDNQDSGCAGTHLVAIADGVGGNVGGAIASSLVISWLARQEPGPTCQGSAAWLSDAVATGNERIRAAYTQQPRLKTMATTLTAVATTGDGELAVAHIGDSRAYLLREGALLRLTRDHTWVQALVDAGGITAEQALTQPGDRLLLCSDGVSGGVPSERMLCVLAGAPSPAAAAALLHQMALDAPAHDNVTVAVADVRAVEHSRHETPAKVGAADSARAETTQPLRCRVEPP